MITISEATENDAQELLKIKIRSFAWDVDKYGMGPPNYDSLEHLINSIEKAFYYKITFEGLLIGGFSLYEKGNLHFELGSLYIDPDYQNRRIGAKVIEYIEKKYSDIIKWSLYTPYLSFRNQHFYEKMGYIKVEEIRIEEYKGFTLFRYEKEFEIKGVLIK